MATDFTGQTPAATYSNILQKDGVSGIADGLGNPFLNLANYATVASLASATVLSASYASNAGSSGTSLATGSTYPFTASWARSASYWDSSSVNTWVSNNFQFKIATGSSMPVTSSQTITSSFSVTASYWNSSSIATILNNKQNNISSGSTFPITASWAENSTVSYTSSLYGTSSWARNSISSSYSTTASYSSVINIQQLLTTQSLFSTQSLYATQSIFASSASWASSSLTASYALNGGAGTSLATGSTYPFTSSWALNALNFSGSITSASYAQTASVALSVITSSAVGIISFVPDDITTKGIIGFTTTNSDTLLISHQSSSVGGISLRTSGSQRMFITTTGDIQFTGSVKGVSTASYSVTASYALNGGGSGTSLATGSTYPFTASWSVTASAVVNASMPFTLSDAATIATDINNGNHFRVTLGGNRVLGNPTNPKDSGKALWELIQDATGNRTITLADKFVLSKDINSITLSSESLARDYLTAVYSSGRDQWDVVGFIRGFNSPTGSNLLVATASLAISASYAPPVAAQYIHNTGSYTLQNTDNGNVVMFSSSSVVTVTITGSLSSDFSCVLYQSGSGPLWITGSDSIIRSRANSTGSNVQYSLLSVFRVPNGDFVLGGALA